MFFKETHKISQAGLKGKEKDKSKVLEQLRKDRLRREEEVRRRTAAAKIQRAARPWLERVKDYRSNYQSQFEKRMTDMKKLKLALPAPKFRAVCAKALDYFAEVISMRAPFTSLVRNPDMLKDYLDLFSETDMAIFINRNRLSYFHLFRALEVALVSAGFHRYFKNQIDGIIEAACTLIDKTQEFKESRIIFSRLVKNTNFLTLLSDSLITKSQSNLGAFLLGSAKLYCLSTSQFYTPLTATFNEFIWRLPCGLFESLIQELFDENLNIDCFIRKLTYNSQDILKFKSDLSSLQMLINLLKAIEKMNKSKESFRLINLMIDFIAAKEEFIELTISQLAPKEKQPDYEELSDEEEESKELKIGLTQNKQVPSPIIEEKGPVHIPVPADSILFYLNSFILSLLKEDTLLPLNSNLTKRQVSVEFYVKLLRLLSILEGERLLDGSTHQLHNILLKDSHFSKELFQVLEERTQFEASFKETETVLELFCNMYSHTLLMMDDFEFKGERQSKNSLQLPLQKLRKFAKYINRMALLLFSNLKGNHKSLKRSIKILVKALYERERRCKLFEESFWIEKSPYIPQSPHQKINYSLELKSIISNTPHCMPFELRKRILTDLLKRDKEMAGAGMEYIFENGPNYIHIRREFIMEDAFFKIAPLGSEFKKIVNISFVDQFGTAEPGIDGGGLFKEFMTLFCRKIFDPNVGYFIETPEHTLTPNPQNLIGYKREKHYEVIGMMVGKAIYEGVLIEPCLSRVFIAKMQGRNNSSDDLQYIDPVLHKNLTSLKWTNVDDLGLYFVVDEQRFGEKVQVPLVPGGENIPVTEENKEDFIFLTANYKLNLQMEYEAKAFRHGLSKIIPDGCLDLFSPDQLLRLISGDTQGFEIEELKRNCQYHGYTEKSQTVRRLWKLLEEFDQKQKKQFLLFVTGCSRPPLMGFESLNPLFAIARVDSRNDTLLPESSTCVNLLRLPDYSSEADLRTRLNVAMENSQGFGLA